jgi:hypothetical protein
MLVSRWASAYVDDTADAYLLEFSYNGYTFLFDQASAGAGSHADRTVCAWGPTVLSSKPRDAAYQRGYPSPNGRAERDLDKGHMIPNQVAGEYGPNIYPQDRALNRGWSEEGKRYRALEREGAATPGTWFACRLLYADDSDFPAWVELAIGRATGMYVERFRNRFD